MESDQPVRGSEELPRDWICLLAFGLVFGNGVLRTHRECDDEFELELELFKVKEA